MEIQAPKVGIKAADDCTYEAALEWIQERYPDARIHTAHKGSGLCTYVDGALAIKPSRFSDNGWKLCNEFSSQWEEEARAERVDRAEILDFLKTKLLHVGFLELGPYSFVYKNDVDGIFVYVEEFHLIIIHDGQNVFDSFKKIKLDSSQDLDKAYLQPILHCFK